jgi:hypothetical protein
MQIGLLLLVDDKLSVDESYRLIGDVEVAANDDK